MGFHFFSKVLNLTQRLGGKMSVQIKKNWTIVLTILVACVMTTAAQVNGAEKTFAQKLVDDSLKRHPDVIVLVMHVTPPGKNENIIIASNIGRIGKKADEDDMRVIETGKAALEVNKRGDRLEAEVVLQDEAGKTIGALGVVAKYKLGDDKEAFLKTAEGLRDELRKQIPSTEKLFEKVSP
jgi:hypothetical protein